MTLPVNNLSVKELLSVLGLTSRKARDIFYKSNGALKSELELQQTVSGLLNSSYCSNISTLRTRRNLASFKGYSHVNLNISQTRLEVIWKDTASHRINVTGANSYELSYNSNYVRVDKKSNYFLVSFKSQNTSVSNHKDYNIVVSCGSQKKILSLRQKMKPYISGLSSTVYLDYKRQSEVFEISTNYQNWSFSSNNYQFSAIYDGEMLRVGFFGEDSMYSSTGRISIYLDGVSYSFDIQYSGKWLHTRDPHERNH
ncbi:MAG: hypothetical protein N4A49_06780 [Marinifilaceae bacterium]|jgi:hypothetical protein|nr:hypothetical protein [Marinifilaceae bacterium]